jgi:uncharacterized protein YecE (DUF72 family)
MAFERYFEYYARSFGTVEINNTFYRMPVRRTFIQWRREVPERFLFSINASRFLTHMKKLKDAKKPLGSFLKATSALEGKAGPILFQLPLRWKLNHERLVKFLALLPGEGRYAFEFRDTSWFTEEVYAALQTASAAFWIYHLAGLLSPSVVTTDFVYVRLHGPGKAYQGTYADRDLARWSEDFASWSREGKDVFCYLDNDEAGYAVRDALRLQAICKAEP